MTGPPPPPSEFLSTRTQTRPCLAVLSIAYVNKRTTHPSNAPLGSYSSDGLNADTRYRFSHGQMRLSAALYNSVLRYRSLPADNLPTYAVLFKHATGTC